MDHIEIQITQEIKQLDTFEARLKDLPHILAGFSSTIGEIVARNFAAQGRPIPWAHRKPTKNGYRGPILVDSGLLLKAATHPLVSLQGVAAVYHANVGAAGVAHTTGAKGTVQVRSYIRRATQAFGKTLAHPVFQMVRAYRREANLPRREFFNVPAEDTPLITQKVANYLLGEGNADNF